MDIRYARRKDLKQAAAFLDECWRWAYKDILDADFLAGLSSKERYKRQLASLRKGEKPLLLFDDRGELLGFCRFGKSRTEGYPEDGEITAIYVREDAVGKGYGHALLTRAEEELRTRGHQNLVLDVLSQNARAIEFYRAHGYAKTGDRVFNCGGREYPLDIMRKPTVAQNEGAYMNETLIEFRDVTFAYPGEEGAQPVPAVKGLTFSIRRGEFAALLGRNGSGKSTVAKLCNGLLTPQRGQVLVEGLDTAQEENLFDIRSRVGMVFQNPDNQIIAAIVEDDVAFGPENLCVPPGEMRLRVDEALRSVGMYELRLAEPHKLSGGQKQRVAIAGVLAMHNAMIVLDESTAMLDPRGRAEVLDTVLRLNRERGITVLFITHFMEEAVRAQRVMVMDEGALLLDGPPGEVFAQEEILRRAGLELPAAARFAELVREEFPGLPGGILTEEECAREIYGLFS